MPREQRERRETKERKDSQRKPLGAASSVRSGLGCGQSQKQLPVGAVPSPGRCPRDETSGRCRSPHHAHYRLPPAAARNNIPGLRGKLLRSAAHTSHNQATVKRLEALGHRVTLDSPLSTALNQKLSATS